MKLVKMPMWRNWQTHTTQNRAGNHVGSSPTIGTIDESVRNFESLDRRYKDQSEMVDFLLRKIIKMQKRWI